MFWPTPIPASSDAAKEASASWKSKGLRMTFGDQMSLNGKEWAVIPFLFIA
jgi:hypothetical protein